MRNKKKNTKQKRKGVSLIVLVITIVVMVILAAAVAVTLNNTGILDKANTAVYNTNKSEVHTMVQLLLLNGNGTIDGDKLQEEVAKMGGTCEPNAVGGWNVTIKSYSCSVMPNGSIGEFSSETAQKNQYGFYENEAYVGSLNGQSAAIVIKNDKTIEAYIDGIYAGVVSGTTVVAEVNSYNAPGFGSFTTTDGVNISAIYIQYVNGQPVEIPCTLRCVFGVYHELYRGIPYNIEEDFGGGQVVANEDGSATVVGNTEATDNNVSVNYDLGSEVTHSFLMTLGEQTFRVYLTLDAKEVYVKYPNIGYVKLATLSTTEENNEADWDYAWTYTVTGGVGTWSSLLVHEDGDVISTGADIVAKLVPNEKVLIAESFSFVEENDIQLPEGNGYTLVIDGSGELILPNDSLATWEELALDVFNLLDVDVVVESEIENGSNIALRITDAVIGEGITGIYNGNLLVGCFGMLLRLESVTLPESLTSIGDWAFFCCKNLKNITIPTSVTNIGERAFQDCSSLTSITIPSSVTNIGESLFCNCNNLETVNIYSTSSSLTIGERAFTDMKNSSTIYVVKDSGIDAKLTSDNYDSNKTTISATLTSE